VLQNEIDRLWSPRITTVCDDARSATGRLPSPPYQYETYRCWLGDQPTTSTL